MQSESLGQKKLIHGSVYVLNFLISSTATFIMIRINTYLSLFFFYSHCDT